MNEQLLKDAEKNHSRLVSVYKAALELVGVNPPPLPDGDITSQVPLVKSLGLLEKMAQGFAIAMDDDFNSRQALAKVSNGARLIPQILKNEDIDERDTAAFAIYAIDWLEEFAGSVLGLLPAKDAAMAVHDPSLDLSLIHI